MAENTAMDIHEILNHLPHRYPFVLIDKVISMELGKEIFAIKNVSINEPFLTNAKYFKLKTDLNRHLNKKKSCENKINIY